MPGRGRWERRALTGIDPVAELGRSLRAISRHNNAIQAFLAVAERDRAVVAAAAAAERRAAGAALGPLDGVVVAVKDNIDTAGLATTLGSAIYAGRLPDRDAEVVRRLRMGGAIVVGKTNMTELACGTTGGDERFGAVLNPIHRDRLPGGSSSGSAAAVAAGMVAMAVGTDTSCSIRYPAAACGVVGLKPTFGRVSTDGVGVCSGLLDHVGPLARVADVAAGALAVMQGDGWDDPMARLDAPVTGLRVGVLGGAFIDRCEAGVATRFEAAVGLLGSLGCAIGRAELPVDPDEVIGHADVLCHEMLGRYGPDVAAAPNRVGPELSRWFADYRAQTRSDRREARRFRRAVLEATELLMNDFDIVVCPTMRAGPGPVDGATASDRVDRADRVGNCAIWSMSGQPSLTVPYPADRPDRNDRSHSSPTPFGLLITGRRGQDATVLGLGQAVAGI